MSDALRMIVNTLNSLPSSVLIYDREGRLIDANQTAYIMHGVSSMEEIDPPEGVAKAREKAMTGEYCTTEYRIVDKKTGKERWLKAHCNPVYTEGDGLVGVSIFEKDITSQKEIMKELLSLKVK